MDRLRGRQLAATMAMLGLGGRPAIDASPLWHAAVRAIAKVSQRRELTLYELGEVSAATPWQVHARASAELWYALVEFEREIPQFSGDTTPRRHREAQAAARDELRKARAHLETARDHWLASVDVIMVLQLDDCIAALTHGAGNIPRGDPQRLRHLRYALEAEGMNNGHLARLVASAPTDWLDVPCPLAATSARRDADAFRRELGRLLR
ncbi:MAG: hypothetical protein KC503_20995 [Myxococcales bacterium]|nr:hypothetical protein [Myxococcales bacterium]